MRVVTAACVAAAVAALAVDQAGYFPHSWIWAAVVPAWLAVLAALLRARIAFGRAELAWLAGLVGLTGWTALSSRWSDNSVQSVLDARRDLVYVASALALVAVLDRRRARVAAAAVCAVVGVVLVVALVRYLTVPFSQRIDVYQGALLSWPLGYANAIGALAAMTAPLALAFAAHARRALARAAAGAVLAPLLAALALASSRGGAIAAAAGFAVLLWLDPRRGRVVRVALPLAPAAALVAVACIHSRLADQNLASGEVGRGRILAAAAILAGGALLAAVSARRVRPRRRSAVPGRSAAAALAAAAVALGVIVAALPRLGGERLLRALVGTQRAAYWAVAWREVARRPGAGTGAGTFGRSWLALGPGTEGGALDAHNLYLESLAELGVPGLLLVLAVLGAPLAAARRAARVSRVGAAVAAAYVAFLVHAFVDWDWELPAVTVTALVLGGSLLALGRRPRRLVVLGRRGRIALAAAAVVLAVLALLGVGRHAVPAATAATGATVAATETGSF